MDPGDDIYLEDRTEVAQHSEDPSGHCGLVAECSLGVILMPGTAQPGPVDYWQQEWSPCQEWLQMSSC